MAFIVNHYFSLFPERDTFKILYELFFNNLNYLFFKSTFIDHNCKKLNKLKPFRYPIVSYKINKYNASRKY